MDHKEIEKYRLELKDLSKEKTKDFKKVKCPSCSSGIKSDDINIQDKIAKCSNCDSVFSFEKDLVDLNTNESPKHELIRPEGIELFYFRDELEISMKRPIRTWEQVLAATVPLISFFISLAYLAPKSKMSLFAFLTILFVGALPIIYLILRRNQKVYINADDKYLTVTKDGLLKKDSYFEVRDIDQIYINSLHHKYYLNAIINTPSGQRHVKLISEMTSISKAKYLEQEIEKHLGIKNRPVPEELK